MNINKIKSLMQECIQQDVEEARTIGKHGYMCRCLVMATMPHKDPKKNEFERTSGAFTLNMISPAHVGLPYGTKPRLIMAFISRQAVLKKNPHISLGRNLADFMRQLGLESSGRPIAMVKDQMKRLFNTTISYQENTLQARRRSGRFGISSEEVTFWSHNNPLQDNLWESTVTLTHEFYTEIITNPVSLDLRALQMLKESSMGLDIYCWLTFRMSYLKQPTEIPWEYLMLQFGSEYNILYDFKRKFLIQLEKVLLCYPEAKVHIGKYGIWLHPSPTHIPMLR
jgi:hypothetical protein